MTPEDDDFVFLPARASDAAAMRSLARSAYRHYVERIGQEPPPMTSDYEALAATADVLLVWRGSVLAGMLITELEEHALLIANVAVAPDLQGRGLGSRLLARAERMAVEAGRREVRLYTNEAMTESIALYRRRGFVETHRSVDGGLRRLFFSKRL